MEKRYHCTATASFPGENIAHPEDYLGIRYMEDAFLMALLLEPGDMGHFGPGKKGQK